MRAEKLHKKSGVCFSDGILLLSLLLVGSFHEYISCLLACLMSGYLLFRMHKDGQLVIPQSFLTLVIGIVCLSYGLSCFWAIDKGMAAVGFLKFLPLFLYMIVLQQKGQGRKVLEILPLFGAFSALVSGIGMQFSAIQDLFSVAGRAAGFFQYPNTFAIFLLVCELLVLKKPGKKLVDYIVLLVLVAGLLYSGSRTAFVVAILANLAMLLAMGKQRLRVILLGGVAVLLLVAILLMLREDSVLRRYLTISLTESTFVGRLLYWRDALALVARYPFGMGYMGYYYAQQSIQTGVYSVMFIHNDFLQLLLDIGWFPFGLLMGTLGVWFFKKQIPVTEKIIVGAICLHSFFDFNLQYISMFMLLILLLQGESTIKVKTLKASAVWSIGLGAVLSVGLYFGTALTLSHFGQCDVSDLLYPFNTQNKLQMLEKTQDVETANTLADEILKQNTAFFAPYSAKAMHSYSQGDFNAMIRYTHEALARNPFGHTEYENYCRMLMAGIEQYQRAGDSSSVAVCRQELLWAQQQLSANTQRLSKLGTMINDQPVTELPADITAYISGIGG